MLVNADFSLRAAVVPQQYQWVASPQPGVERVMLDRLGAETGRATSIVRYASGSSFPQHRHSGGEEILVLGGTFSEGSDHYPAGWYLRNPPGSSHRPFSDEGATLFVKLCQMRADETQQVRIDTRDASRWIVRDGRQSCPLFAGRGEQVSIERLAPSAGVFSRRVEGAEMLVLEGSLHEGAMRYDPGSWIRLPAGQYPAFIAGSAGAAVYLRIGAHPEGGAAEQGARC
ncbi:MAG TPA: cupin domain-containing protein [Rubrivivax sp.]|nr:cupin domain-containing protein [Rubrivivax sp.]